MTELPPEYRNTAPFETFFNSALKKLCDEIIVAHETDPVLYRIIVEKFGFAMAKASLSLAMSLHRYADPDRRNAFSCRYGYEAIETLKKANELLRLEETREEIKK